VTKPTLMTRSAFLAQAGALFTVLGAAGEAQAKGIPGAKKKYTMVVLTNPKPGKDAEFNDWYNNHHLHDVLKVPGIASAQRFKLVVPAPGGTTWHYYSAYHIEADDPKATVDELIKRYGTDQMQLGDSMDPVSFFSVYEAITPVVKE
jgi:hypothetical protein